MYNESEYTFLFLIPKTFMSDGHFYFILNERVRPSLFETLFQTKKKFEINQHINENGFVNRASLLLLFEDTENYNAFLQSKFMKDLTTLNEVIHYVNKEKIKNIEEFIITKNPNYTAVVDINDAYYYEAPFMTTIWKFDGVFRFNITQYDKYLEEKKEEEKEEEACKREIPWLGDNCLDLARTLAQRSDCLRRQYGCVIVKDGRIVSTGYNAAPKYERSCYVRGNCARKGCKHNSGSYDECKSVHAEQQALINADPRDLEGATLYLAGFENGVELTDVKPCPICERMLYFAKIKSYITNGEEMIFNHESYN